MILAAHLLFSAYGFWLPNDPRGSWSDFIRAFELLKHGNATKTDTRQSVAGAMHNSALRAAAKKELAHPPVIFINDVNDNPAKSSLKRQTWKFVTLYQR